jgi:hypothetical protein
VLLVLAAGERLYQAEREAKMMYLQTFVVWLIHAQIT